MKGSAGRRTGWLATCAVTVAVGCTDTRTYSVSVRNATLAPVTVCLTKSHGPAEPGWESPEQVAGPAYPGMDERPPGVVVRPGQTAREGPITGEFYRGSGHAVLRVYAGTPTLNQMNAISAGDLDRLDLPLRPGNNALVVQDEHDGHMHVVPASEARQPNDLPPVPVAPGPGNSAPNP